MFIQNNCKQYRSFDDGGVEGIAIDICKTATVENGIGQMFMPVTSIQVERDFPSLAATAIE